MGFVNKEHIIAIESFLGILFGPEPVIGTECDEVFDFLELPIAPQIGSNRMLWKDIQDLLSVKPVFDELHKEVALAGSRSLNDTEIVVII